MAANLIYRTSTQIPPSTTQIKTSPLTHEEMDGNLKSLDAAIDAVIASITEINFVPADIASYLIDGASSVTQETGSSKSSVALTWTLTGSAPTTQSISNGVGAVAVGTLNRTVTGPFTANQTWVLTVTDNSPGGASFSDTATVSLNFRQKRYWGVSTSTSLNSAGILALSNEFATSKAKSITYNATGGRYIYYAYPASFGAIASVLVNGLAFSDFTETLVNFTNASGFTESYRVLRFNSLQNGASIPVVWA